MRETRRDDKWADEREANDRRRDEYIASDSLEAAKVSTGPSETELVTVALLMRLYDINLALLAYFNDARANEIYEAHEKGGSFNPPVFIPSMEETDDAEL